MASIDITELLDDPDFSDTFFLRRQHQNIDSSGLAHNAETSVACDGVCFPGGGNKLIRTRDGDRVEADMTIVTRTILHDGRGGEPADNVEWMGLRYVVTLVEDYANWGGGFVQARCNLTDLRG